MAASRQPLLVVFGGLPGTGKTTISRELTRRLSATYLRIDAIEQSLYAAGQAGGEMGYVIANALAAENLKLGRMVIADCVNPVVASRNGWRETARGSAARIVEIETVCSDLCMHRSRLEGRLPDIYGHDLPTWGGVVNRVYEPWDRGRLILDTATSSIEQLVDIAESHVRGVTL
ncbi:AAA family ATPase [Bradyrhizobium sp. CCGB01]|uniref:AAA family ATPase n=1 Tax=Bradyrhizobium sp. CCGB01 TaxID=2949634 RepID=UPI0020B30D6D|nr:AAA family ATPase [Bradyrhizobium sp. CCGB01]MCP3411694.1 ATP-binding protein [Bradyrhizobium sp. CCGB01]